MAYSGFFLLVVIAGPISEEIIFQRVIQYNLYVELKRYQSFNNLICRYIAILGATMLFILFRIWGESDIGWLLDLSNSGLIFFAIIYDLTRFKLMYPIVVHIGINLLAFIAVVY